MGFNLEDTTELVLAANAGTVNLAAVGGKGPTGPAGADGGSDASYAGFVSDTTPSATRAAILALGGIVDGLASLDSGAKVPTAELPSGAAGGVAYGNGTDLAFTAPGTSGQILTSNGSGAPTWTTPSTGSPTSLLAYAASSSTAAISTTSTTPVDIDAALTATITVPASGAIVVIVYGGVANPSSSANRLVVSVYNTTAAATFAGTSRTASATLSGTGIPLYYRTRITGLTPGASLSLKPQYASSGGTSVSISRDNATFGNLAWEVHSA